jgi:DNA topoisomerase I
LQKNLYPNSMSLPTEELLDKIEDADLRYIAETSRGYSRLKKGEHFQYFNTDGKRISDEKVIERINKLRIPPAWKKVWISPNASTHLQATGYDDKGRKQYIYHQKWIELSQQTKFDKLIDFALSLPKIRSRLRYDLGSGILDRKKVIATVVWLLQKTFIRVGNEEYARENESFGLTTLRNKHVKVRGSEVNFQFKGKSGVEHMVAVSDPKVAKVIKQCMEIPGFELFQYVDEKGVRHVIDSSDVNGYLLDTTKEKITAKDFRTWGGTTLGATTLYQLGDFLDEKHLKKNLVDTVKTVSNHLRNTVAVCRSYYIHPAVFKSYEEKRLIPHFNYAVTDSTSGLYKDEYRVLTLLQKYS